MASVNQKLLDLLFDQYQVFQGYLIYLGKISYTYIICICTCSFNKESYELETNLQYLRRVFFYNINYLILLIRYAGVMPLEPACLVLLSFCFSPSPSHYLFLSVSNAVYGQQFVLEFSTQKKIHIRQTVKIFLLFTLKTFITTTFKYIHLGY